MGLGARRARGLVATAVLLLGLGGPGGAQLLFDEDVAYENYAEQGYRPYTAGVFGRTTRNVYDQLGTFLMDGVQVYELDEGRTDAPNPGSYVDKGYFYGAYLNRLLVAQDSYRNWSSRLIVGDQIRTKFTSLTLDMVALNGVRWDMDVGGSQLTVVTSRHDWPIYTDADNTQHSGQGWASYLLGGHFKRSLGAVDVSLSYVNQHRTNSLVGWGENSLKGVLPVTNTPPAYVVVKVSDDSDRDDGGPIVYRLWVDELILDADGDRVRVDPDTAQVWGELFRPDITRHDSEVVDPTYPNRDRYLPENRSIPPYFEYQRGLLPVAGGDGSTQQQVDGTEYVLYWFAIPQDLRNQLEELHFRADVANDYRIEMAEVYLSAAVATSSNPDITGEQASYFRPVAAAPGNVQDTSNRRQVRFEFGRQTGRTNLSLRLEAEVRGFQLRTEYAHTFSYYQYPTAAAGQHWHRRQGGAFFVNVEKRFGPWSTGGEYFDISPRYGTMLSVQDANYLSYTDLLNSPFSVFPSFPGRYNNTVELSTVDDNDDRDRYPDDHFLDEFADNDGIFPGLDQDQDGRPDTNENGNNQPDYLEPFLLYDSDPPEYDYGDDLNNNGVIDHREDDLEPDYPYDVDRKGYHLFAEVEPVRHAQIALGHYDTREIWRGGRNRVTYGKLDLRRSFYPHGVLQVANTLKRVRDDIEDDTPQFAPLVSNGVPFEVRGSVSGASDLVLVEDELAMRDSWVNTAYVDATWFRVDGLRLSNRVKYTVNWQGRTARQQADAVHEGAWVLRGAYRWQLGRLQVSPKVKLMGYWRRSREDLLRAVGEGYFYPMVVSEYQLTPQTRLSAGAQGLPFLRCRYRDFEHGDVDYGSEDYIVAVTNSTTYNGYHLSLNLGYHLKRIRYDERHRAGEDLDRSLYFLRLIMGLEPFKG